MAHGSREQRVGRTIRAQEAPFAVERHVFFEDLTVAQGEARGRQRVDHFVREQHAVPRFLRRGVQPFDQIVEQRVEACVQAFLLACAQVRARLEDGVARGQGVGGEELLQRDFGEGTAAAAEFDDVGTGAQLVQHGREAVGDAGREQGAELGCGDEVAGGAELRRARTVVTQAGRVEAQLHEAGERDRAARSDDLLLDTGTQAFAVGQRIGVGGALAGIFRRCGHGRRMRQQCSAG